MLGVVRAPSAFSITFAVWRQRQSPCQRVAATQVHTTGGVVDTEAAFSGPRALPSITATHELVVPRSMPMTSPPLALVSRHRARRASKQCGGHSQGGVTTASLDPRLWPCGAGNRGTRLRREVAARRPWLCRAHAPERAGGIHVQLLPQQRSAPPTQRRSCAPQHGHLPCFAVTLTLPLAPTAAVRRTRNATGGRNAMR